MERKVIKNDVKVVNGMLVVTTEVVDTLSPQDVIETMDKMKGQLIQAQEQVEAAQKQYNVLYDEFKEYEKRLMEMSTATKEGGNA